MTHKATLHIVINNSMVLLKDKASAIILTIKFSCLFLGPEVYLWDSWTE